MFPLEVASQLDIFVEVFVANLAGKFLPSVALESHVPAEVPLGRRHHAAVATFEHRRAFVHAAPATIVRQGVEL